MTRILGIDPGLNTTGYGVVDFDGLKFRMVEAGVVRSRAKGTIQSRVNEIFSGVREVIEDHHPDLLSLEQLFSHYSRPTTAILMGHARGVICLAAAQFALDVVHLEPTKVKKVMTGNGRASKAQMQLAVKMQLDLEFAPEPHDVADALAIAICGHQLGPGSVLQKLTNPKIKSTEKQL
ncbi:Crossover junction endodeoxyribonuclease RuvC [Rubripirellula obstinata]|uniref:Crossover junction endodeoxyribonuclease RuvC n=1 Tax=Rubripirellula obstinata TaxID=406547 RepID=A0A5B1CIY1_9BACT|nr:crossover junction endodeoxyribonuclease RuvC [Rubripirellula obstinata]KAA1260211.1 Crossover junction endodeoxyribonuclease RuvC [Rubripirellula obstinata]